MELPVGILLIPKFTGVFCLCELFRNKSIIVEIKKPKLQDGKNQLRSYTNATGAPIAVWTNGGQISHYNRKDPNYFEDITDIPKADQTLEDILKEIFTLKDLIIKDKIPNEGKSLKSIIQEMEDEVLANAGVDVFEEVFKLIFTKLYDEHKSRKDKEIINYFLKGKNYPMVAEPKAVYGVVNKNSYDEIKEKIAEIDDSDFRVLEFRNTGQSEGELKKKIQKLFDEAKAKWPGVFDEADQIQLSPSHLSIVISYFQNIKLFNSNLQIIDEAFEYLINKSVKGEKGQYFTPRHVIDMCVKMLNPKADEYPKAGPLCPNHEDYPIFFAVSEKSGKNNSGEYVFVKNGNNQPKLDKNGHLVINHDLHNHDGELPDGVAEKFIEWAKNEKLSFWK